MKVKHALMIFGLVMVGILVTFSVGCKRNKLTTGDTVNVVRPPRALGITGMWAGSYVLTDNNGIQRGYPLVLDIQHNPNTNNQVVAGTWNNNTDILQLVNSNASLLQAIASFPGTNPFRHYSYQVRVTEVNGNTLSLAIVGNDYNGFQTGIGQVTR